MLDIDIEDALEQPRRRAMRVFVNTIACTVRWTRHDRGAQPGIGREHPMEAD